VLQRPHDADVSLIRFGFEQLDRLNGYASGMPSPEFYQRLWERREVLELLFEVARDMRDRLAMPSTADVAVAWQQIQRLAAFRGHETPTREDLIDGVRSVFIKGADDVEGIAVLAAVRKHLTGSRTGEVPREAGRPAIVLDFERMAASERFDLKPERDHALSLDIHRSSGHRAKSRFLHQLALLEVPFARSTGGPDYVAGTNLDRVTEGWTYRWHPAVEAALVERSRYGATVEEAAQALLLERFEEATQVGQRSELAAKLVLEACRCGLHSHSAALLRRTGPLLASDPEFDSVVSACESLDQLRAAREPLEAHHLTGLVDAVDRAWERGANLVTGLGATSQENEKQVLSALSTWSALAVSTSDASLSGMIHRDVLRALAAEPTGNLAMSGAADGLLYSSGAMTGEELGRRLAGLLAHATTDPSLGARYFTGLQRMARAACWLEAPVSDALQGALRDFNDDEFMAALPHLRLAFSDLTTQETDRLAAVAAEKCGVSRLLPFRGQAGSEHELMLGLRADKLVRDALVRFGWSTDE
jgi:hypothetical protein